MLWRSYPSLTPLMLALRNIKARRMRSVLTCLGIMLGVAAVLAISMTNESTLTAFQRVFDETSGKYHLSVSANQPENKPLKSNQLQKVSSHGDVIAAAPRVSATTFRPGDIDNWSPSVSLSGRGKGNSLMVMGVDPKLDPLVRTYELQSGRWLENDRYEVVVGAQYAQDKDLLLGDKLIILTPTGEAKLKVVGIAKNTGAALMNGGNVAFLPLPVVQTLFERGERLDGIDIALNPRSAASPQRLDVVQKQLQEALGDHYSVEFPAGRGQDVSQMLEIYQQGLVFFSVMALFIGGFLIYNTFSMTVVERRAEIGMLRAVGMSRKQVMVMVLSEALVFGVCGVVLGVVFGYILGRGLMAMMGGLVTVSLSDATIPLSGLLQSLVVGIGVTLFSALVPAAQASNISPLEALRLLSQSSGTVKRHLSNIGLLLCLLGWGILYYIPSHNSSIFSRDSLAVLMMLGGATMAIPPVVIVLETWFRPLLRLVYGHCGDLGSRNIQRSILRTALTVAALMVGITLVVGIGAVTGSFERDLSRWVNTALGGDLQVGSPNPLREQFGVQLAAVPGVQVVSPRTQFDVTPPPSGGQGDHDEALLFNAIDPLTFLQVSDFQFTASVASPEKTWQYFTEGQGIFVSTSVADRYHLDPAVGSTLVLKTQRGEHEFNVLAVVVDFNPQGRSVFGTRQDAMFWFGETRIDRFTLSVEPGYDINLVKQEIEMLYKKRKNIIVATSLEFEQRLNDLTQQAFVLLDVLSLIGVMISSLGVVNTLMMSVMERQREIGGLRSLGMLRRQVWQMILAEAASLGIFGGLFGVLFGSAMASVLVHTLNALGSYNLEFIIPLQVFVRGAFISLVVSQFAALYPARQAAKANIIRSIQHE